MSVPAALTILSDLHLAPAAREDGVFRRYLNRSFFPDERLAALLGSISGADAEVVLAGDTFDFDLVEGTLAEPGSGPISRWSGAERTAATAVRRLHAILDDHPVFETAFAGLLARGVRVTLLAGNHDTELEWPEVREALGARLDRLGAAGARPSFETWLCCRPGLVYVAHGHQHDPFTRPVDPRTACAAGGTAMRLPFSSICQRALTNHIDTLNSTVEATYILGAGAYILHWWRYHARSRRMIFLPWLLGAHLAVANIFRQERRQPGPPPAEAADAHGALRGLPKGAGAAIAALWPAPVIRDVPCILRELWLDRAIALDLALVVGAFLILLGAPRIVAAGTAVGLLGLMLRALTSWKGSSPVAAYMKSLPATAERMAAAAAVPFVVLGHTHHARVVPFERGAYLNAGAWSPGFLDPECTRPAHPRFTFVEIDASGREARLCRQDESGRVVLETAAVPRDPGSR